MKKINGFMINNGVASYKRPWESYLSYSTTKHEL